MNKKQIKETIEFIQLQINILEDIISEKKWYIKDMKKDLKKINMLKSNKNE